MTGCGANLIRVPSRTRPNKASKHAAEQNDGKGDRQDERNAAGGNFRRAGMNQSVNQQAEEKGAVDPRRIDGRGLVAEHHANDGDDQRGGQAGECAVGEIILAERGQGEHAVAHGEWNGDGCGDKPADEIVARMFGPFHEKFAPGSRPCCKKCSLSIGSLELQILRWDNA